MSTISRLLLCTALSTGACDEKGATPSNNEDGPAAAKPAGAAAGGVGLATAPPAGASHMPRMARVNTKGLLAIDPVPLTMVISPGEVILQRGASPMVHDDRVLVRADPRTAENHLIAPLFDALTRALEEGPSGDETWSDMALLVLEPDTTMAALVDVLYSSGRAGLVGYVFVVDTPEGKLGMRVLPPKFCSRLAEGGKACVRPQVVFATDGLMLSARRFDEYLGCMTADAHTAPYADKTITGPDGRCPLPRDGGPQDPVDLRWFLQGLSQVEQTCQHAMFSAESSVRWREMAPTLAELHQAMPHGLVIEAGIPAGGCTDTFVVGEAGG